MALAFEYLEAYATFDSVADMDQHVEQHIQQHYFNLTESERAIVFTLASRSLAYPGVSHLKAETIANQVGVSTKTVYRSVKKLAQLGIIEKVAGTKLNGIKGASIYLILPYVLSSVSERVIANEMDNGAVCEQQSENQSSKSFNLLNSKTSSLQEIYNNAHFEKEDCKEYMNEYQIMLYDFMHSLPLQNVLKDELHKLVLASQVDSVQAFHRAKEVIFNMARDIASGVLTVTSTLRAVFVGAFKAHNKSIAIRPIESIQESKRPVPFYDWLTERENCPQVINNHRPIENWLEW